jgi:gas vesicle protein
MDKDSSSGFVSGLVMGAVLGAVITLLYAPQPGSETRRLVKEKASSAASKIKESVKTLVKRED